MNLRPAPPPLVAALKRRLESALPPAQLVMESVKRLSIPGDHRELTLFICVPHGRGRMFVAEYAEGSDLRVKPQFYCAIPLPADDEPKEVLRVMLSAIRSVAMELRERDIKAQPIILRPVLRLVTPKTENQRAVELSLRNSGKQES